MKFIGNFLRNVATKDILSLTNTLLDFDKKFPRETANCIGNLAETDDVKEAYGILEIPFPILGLKFAEYVVRHIGDLGDQASKAYFFYFQGMYNDLGVYFGKVAKEIFKKNYFHFKLEELHQILKKMNL